MNSPIKNEVSTHSSLVKNQNQPTSVQQLTRMWSFRIQKQRVSSEKTIIKKTPKKYISKCTLHVNTPETMNGQQTVRKVNKIKEEQNLPITDDAKSTVLKYKNSIKEEDVDMFGLNSLEKSTDHYLVEAYNNCSKTFKVSVFLEDSQTVRDTIEILDQDLNHSSCDVKSLNNGKTDSSNLTDVTLKNESIIERFITIQDRYGETLKLIAEHYERSSDHDYNRISEILTKMCHTSQYFLKELREETKRNCDPPDIIEENVSNEEEGSILENDDFTLDPNSKVCDEVETSGDSLPNKTDSSDSDEDSKSYNNSRMITRIINELIATEQTYCYNLKHILQFYRPYLEKFAPENSNNIFGNLEEIYQGAKDFLKRIQDCKNVQEIAQTFIDSKPAFDLYVLYVENKPNSDKNYKIIKDQIKTRRVQMCDSFDLDSFLFSPFQRMGKYILMLEKMVKETRRIGVDCNGIIKALTMIQNITRKCDDIVAINAIHNSPIQLKLQGDLIDCEEFTVYKRKKLKSTKVYYFEKVIVFTQNNNGEDHFVDCIALENLMMGPQEKGLLRLELTDFNRKKNKHPQHTYYLEAKDVTTKDLWVQQINKQLLTQMDLAKKQSEKVIDKP